LEFLKTVYLSALDAGAKELVVVDTIGACGPEASEYLTRQVCQWAGKGVPVHFHGHNDFGMATACAVPAVRGGATWIQGTINGMGERAGNSDIAEIALALRCLYDVPVVLNLEKVREVSEVVRRAAGYTLDAWKPLVGENLFMRESGAVASQFHVPEAIEPYSAEIVQAERGIVLGKKSGLDNIDLKCKETRRYDHGRAAGSGPGCGQTGRGQAGCGRQMRLGKQRSVSADSGGHAYCLKSGSEIGG
jgi:isopropylmalate/homocitrate/citramalate synthase